MNDKLIPPTIINGVTIIALENTEHEYRGETWITLIPDDEEDSRIWEFSLTSGKIIQTHG